MVSVNSGHLFMKISDMVQHVQLPTNKRSAKMSWFSVHCMNISDCIEDAKVISV